MGSGMGPNMGGMTEPDPRNPMCGETPKPARCYVENRATLPYYYRIAAINPGGSSGWSNVIS